jgi:CheY-like chemotaxis protein
MSKPNAMNHSVMFIDDDEDDLEMLGDAVASTFPNLECLRFSSPVLAIEYLSSPEVNPLCIFVDINMPVMRGDEVVQRIKIYDHLNNSKIAILSTCINEDARRMLLFHGANYTIVKPSRFIALRDCVCDVITEQLTGMDGTNSQGRDDSSISSH